MDAGSLSDLVRDFTAKLSKVAKEFSERAEDLAGPLATPKEEGEPQSTPQLALVRQLMEQRRLRHKFLPDELFHEPAWDMLLALYVSCHEGNMINVKHLVSCTPVPATTAQRWIDHMAKLGLIARSVDMDDKRRIEVKLSDAGLQMIDQYLILISQPVS
jgi:DNA-binding MarR family transcriptional regulator